MKNYRLAAAAVLFFSFMSHFGEALIISPEHAVGSMIFGLIYFCLGIVLLARHPKAYHLSLFFTTIGAIAACVIIAKGYVNLLIILHVAIDLFVIFVCLKHFKRVSAKAKNVNH